MLVFQDLMFVCASYDMEDEAFQKLIEVETRNELRRIRNHVSLFLIAGNNEIEDGVRGHGQLASISYMKMAYETLAPIVKEETDCYFLPSSPTSGEPLFAMPQDMDYLDTHYWPDVSRKEPLEDFKRIAPRPLSEFGFQSYPSYSTLLSFFKKEDLSEGNAILLKHQDKPGYDDVLPFYVRRYFGEPIDFERSVHLSSLLQAKLIGECVDHMRSNERRCNGALYWQTNDAYPAISWSSIDYKMGIKALLYASRRFFNPSRAIFECDKEAIRIVLSNQSGSEKEYRLDCKIMDFHGRLEKQFDKQLKVPHMVNVEALLIPSSEIAKAHLLAASIYDLEGRLLDRNIYCGPNDKEIDYPLPRIERKTLDMKTFEISSEVFARGVYLCVGDDCVLLSDNYFDLLPGEKKTIVSEKPIDFSKTKVFTVADSRK